MEQTGFEKFWLNKALNTAVVVAAVLFLVSGIYYLSKNSQSKDERSLSKAVPSLSDQEKEAVLSQNNYNSDSYFFGLESDFVKDHNRDRIEIYSNLRNVNGSHAEALSVLKKLRSKPALYFRAKKTGVSDEQILGALRSNFDAGDYISLREDYGLSQEEALYLLNHQVTAKQYLSARTHGARAKDILEAVRAKIDVTTYARALRKGLSHRTILQAKKEGVNILTIKAKKVKKDKKS